MNRKPRKPIQLLVLEKVEKGTSGGIITIIALSHPNNVDSTP